MFFILMDRGQFQPCNWKLEVFFCQICSFWTGQNNSVCYRWRQCRWRSWEKMMKMETSWVLLTELFLKRSKFRLGSAINQLTSDRSPWHSLLKRHCCLLMIKIINQLTTWADIRSVNCVVASRVWCLCCSFIKWIGSPVLEPHSKKGLQCFC